MQPGKAAVMAAAIAISVAAGGCGLRLPGAMGPEMTPDEVRRAHGEGAKYMLNPPETAQPGAAPEVKSTGSFQVAPDLIGQAPTRMAARGPLGASAIPADAPASARYGDLVFVAGRVPVGANPAGIEQQARLALENLRTTLEANRLNMANVITMTVYLQDLNDVRAFDAVYGSYFKGALPMRSVVEVSRLPRNAKVEISAVAGR